MTPISLADVRAAASELDGHVARTPCLHSRRISELAGCDVFLKLENLQLTGSFKERGALHKLLSLSAAERAAGVVAMSAGNHAQGVAVNAQRLGIHAVVVMPRFTPTVKVEGTRALGAEVELIGDSVEEASARANELCRERGLVPVHPFDDLRVIAGQGTVALEMLEDAPDLDALVIPIGGGGLISGCALAARELRPALEVFGVQAARFPSMKQALAGAPIRCGTSTLAGGIAVKSPGAVTLPIVRSAVREIFLVDEDELESAILLLLEAEKTVAEGAGAAALAALLANPSVFAKKRVGVVVSGGNIDMLVLSHVIERGLARSSRLARLLVRMRDVPGELAAISTVIAASGANVVEVLHERAFARAPSSEVEVAFVIEARGVDHVREIVARLAASGHESRAAPR
jgi:threonine dehydratase